MLICIGGSNELLPLLVNVLRERKFLPLRERKERQARRVSFFRPKSGHAFTPEHPRRQEAQSKNLKAQHLEEIDAVGHLHCQLLRDTRGHFCDGH